MRYRIISLALALLAVFTVSAQNLKTETVDGVGAKVWRITADRAATIADRTVNPTYFIYYNGAVSDPMSVVRNLGMERHIDAYLAAVYVINPANGRSYSTTADLEVYYKLLERLRIVNNLKLIGKGTGATFINNVLSLHAEAVAGILTRFHGIFTFVGGVLSVGALVLAIIGIVRAVKGSSQPLPLIGGIQLL